MIKKILLVTVFALGFWFIMFNHQRFNSYTSGWHHQGTNGLLYWLENMDYMYYRHLDNLNQLCYHPAVKPQIETIKAFHSYGLETKVEGELFIYYLLSKENNNNYDLDDLPRFHEMNFIDFLFNFKPMVLDSQVVMNSHNFCYHSGPELSIYYYYKEEKFVDSDEIFRVILEDVFLHSIEINNLKEDDSTYRNNQKNKYLVLKITQENQILKSEICCKSMDTSENLKPFMNTFNTMLTKIQTPEGLTLDSIIIRTAPLIQVTKH